MKRSTILLAAATAAVLAVGPVVAKPKSGSPPASITRSPAAATSAPSAPRSSPSTAVPRGSGGSPGAVDTRSGTRSRDGGHGHGPGHGSGYGYSGYGYWYGYGHGFGYYPWYWRSWSYFPYDYGWYYPGYPYWPARATSERRALGALDLEVDPKRAEVFVDGQSVGEARKFDGFPDYLWLQQGTYELGIFHEGYGTEVRLVTVLPEQVIELEIELAPGDAVRPERPVAAAFEASEVAERSGSGSTVVDARSEPARLVVSVQPADASVYLDGRFVGVAGELAGLRGGLLVDAGPHRVEIVRPGYESDSVDVAIGAGQRSELSVSLAAAD